MAEQSSIVSRDAAGPLYRTAVVVQVAVLLGSTLFGVMAWWLTRHGAVPSMALNEATALVYAWLAAVTGATLAATRMWSARTAMLTRDRRRGPGVPPEALLARLLPIWVVLDAPALFGVLLYLLTGAPVLLLASLLYLWVAMWLARPRSSWREPRP
jgi:hypothetical protein